MLVGWTLELSLNVVSSGWGLGSACTIQAEGHSAVLSAPPHPVHRGGYERQAYWQAFANSRLSPAPSV